MSRLLSIDYGKKRVGIAVSDSLQIIANGLTTVPTAQLFTFLKDYFSKESVERVVIGKPLQTNGSLSENYQRVSEFAKKFETIYPEIPIVWFDERFTSILAHQAMLDAGLKKKARQNKELVDEISATIILRDYMESREFTTK